MQLNYVGGVADLVFSSMGHSLLLSCAIDFGLNCYLISDVFFSDSVFRVYCLRVRTFRLRFSVFSYRFSFSSALTDQTGLKEKKFVTSPRFTFGLPNVTP